MIVPVEGPVAQPLGVEERAPRVAQDAGRSPPVVVERVDHVVGEEQGGVEQLDLSGQGADHGLDGQSGRPSQ